MPRINEATDTDLKVIGELSKLAGGGRYLGEYALSALLFPRPLRERDRVRGTLPLLD